MTRSAAFDAVTTILAERLADRLGLVDMTLGPLLVAMIRLVSEGKGTALSFVVDAMEYACTSPLSNCT